MKEITSRLCDWIEGLKWESISEKTAKKVRFLILDYYAACCAGCRVNWEFNEACKRYYCDMGGAEESTVLFDSVKLPACNAAFLNSCYAHGADMDDGHKKAMGHVGAHVISAVFALGEKIGATEIQIIMAIIVGYEVYCRLAAAAQPGMVKRGFHSTGTAGTIACGAACAKLLNLDKEGVYHTFFLTATQSAGLLVVGETGQAVKPINPARAAQIGVQSALLVFGGVKGGKNPLESDRGWLHSMSEEIDETVLLEGLGDRFAIEECYIKRFPSCRHTHGAADAAWELRRELKVEEIDTINIYIYENAIRLAGEIVEPHNTDEAKFSIHYAVACVLEQGSFGLEDIMTIQINNRRRGLLEKINLIPDSSMEDLKHSIRGARMEIRTIFGKRYDTTVWVPKGDPENPLSEEEIQQKFLDCSKGLAGEQTARQIIDYALHFGREEIFRNCDIVSDGNKYFE